MINNQNTLEKEKLNQSTEEINRDKENIDPENSADSQAEPQTSEMEIDNAHVPNVDNALGNVV